MREIKFRAWNGHKMRYSVNIDHGQAVRYGYQWFNTDNDIREAEPMQFTGLHDNNGVEIYEGDIVKHRVLAANRPPEYYRTICVTDIRKDYSWLSLEGYEWYKPTLDRKLKVIGNIYETPELLNEEIQND